MLAMSRVDLVFFFLLLKHANSAPQTGPDANAIHVTLRPNVPNTNAIHVTLRPNVPNPNAIHVTLRPNHPNTNVIHGTLRPPTITGTLQPPQPIATIPPREAKPLPFYSTTQQPFAKPLPFHSTTQQPFAKPLPFHSTTQQPFAKPLPFYTTSASFIFHDDHNSLQNRQRRSIQSQNGINAVKINNKQTVNTAVPTPVAFSAASRVTTESFRDIVQVF